MLKNIPALTGLRGVGAAWVVFFHLLGKDVPIANHGYMGVDAFFILSGFVLSRGYASRFQSLTIQNYLSFLKARIARIFPLHLFMLLVVAVCVIALPGFRNSVFPSESAAGLSSFIASALLIQNWFHWPPFSWNAPSWSLSAEWALYLAFPLFVLFSQKWRSTTVPLALSALCLMTLAGVFLGQDHHDRGVFGDLGMVRPATEFCCGCLLFRAQSIGMRTLPLWADVISVALLGISVSVPGAVFIGPLAMAMIVLRGAQNSGPIAAFLSMPFVVWLGEISYSLYLVHWPILQLFIWKFGQHPPRVLAVSIIPLMILIACGTHAAIELRAREWGKWKPGVTTVEPLPAS